MRSFSMRAGLLALVMACSASSSFAGFTVTHTISSVNSTLDRIDIYAKNTGGDTGTGLIAAEVFGSNVDGLSLWRSNASGNWSPTNLAEAENRSFLRVDALDPITSSVVVKEPAANQPLAPQFGSNTVTLGNFGVTVASLTGPVPAETGLGAMFASLFVTKGYHAAFNGNVGGSAGPKASFSFYAGYHIDYVIQIRSITPNPANVVFGPVVSGGAPFSVTVEVGGAPTGSNVFLTMGGIPNGIHDLSIVGGGTESRTFVVSGLVDYSLNGMMVDLPFTANCPGIFIPTDYGSIRLNITPEPALAFSLLLSGAILRRARPATT